MKIPKCVTDTIRKLPDDMHKGQAGKTLIVAGSPGMAGAAVLSARAALRSGAGIVKVGICSEILNVIQISVPEAMCVDRDRKTAGILPTMNPEEFDSIAIGPGIGAGKEQCQMTVRLLSDFEGPMIIDADGLNSLSQHSENFAEVCRIIKERKGKTIITPHPGEANRILKALGENTVQDMGRVSAAKAISQGMSTVTLLKGPGTVVCSPDGSEIYINETGNPGMATGGSGDVLTGIIAALLAGESVRGTVNCVQVAAAGAYIHGLAGDIAAENFGQQGMISGDIANCIAKAIEVINNGGNDGY